jgi:kynurenine formamidase
MQILKQDLINLVSNLPDKIDMEEFMYKLHVLDKTKKGQMDIKKDNFATADELQINLII